MRSLFKNRQTLGDIPQLPRGAVFSPTSISGLSVWLDASQLSLNNNDAVTSWADMSGNGRHFTGGTANYITNVINGKPVIRLNSSNVLYNTTNFGRPISVFYVGKQNDTADGRLLSGKANNWLMGHWSTKKEQFYAEGWISNNGNGPAKDSNWHIWICTQSNSSAAMYDGLTQCSMTFPGAGTQGPNGLVFTGYTGTSEKTNCDIAELLVYNSELSATDREKVTNYLKAKYNL